MPTIAAVFLVFCALNIYSYVTMHGPYDGMAYFGWPFNMYGAGGFMTWTRQVIWTGLIGNVIVALYVASVAEIARAAIKIFVRPNLK
jgi:hypothetical protein